MDVLQDFLAADSLLSWSTAVALTVVATNLIYSRVFGGKYAKVWISLVVAAFVVIAPRVALVLDGSMQLSWDLLLVQIPSGILVVMVGAFPLNETLSIMAAAPLKRGGGEWVDRALSDDKATFFDSWK